MRLKEFFYYWLPVIVYMLFIFILSNTPSPILVNKIKLSNFDLVEHMVEYFILAFLLLRLTFNLKLKKPFLAAIIVSIVYGIFDEFHQLFIPGRFFSVYDMLADSFGSCFIVIFKYNKKLLKSIKK